jgi:hypothetical protein
LLPPPTCIIRLFVAQILLVTASNNSELFFFAINKSSLTPLTTDCGSSSAYDGLLSLLSPPTALFVFLLLKFSWLRLKITPTPFLFIELSQGAKVALEIAWLGEYDLSVVPALHDVMRAVRQDGSVDSRHGGLSLCPH